MEGGPISRRSALGGAVIVALSSLGGCGARPESTSAASTSVLGGGMAQESSARFIDSVGVNAHWTYGDTPYARNYEQVASLLQRSGIPHVRGEVGRAEDLALRGIKTTVLVDSSMQGQGTPASRIEEIRRAARAGCIAAVEGPNEADAFWVNGGRTYRGEAYPKGLVDWQQDLYSMVKMDRDFQGVSVIGPSLGKTYWSQGNPLPARSLESVVDYGNFHPYIVGNPFTNPSPYAGIDRYYWDANFPSIALDVHPINMTTYSPPFGNKPMMATETGYASSRLTTSEAVKAKYVPRIFLENFRLGIVRTYLYQLVNEYADPSWDDRNQHWGLINNDLTLTPAFRALETLLEQCRPNGAVPADLTTSLPISVTAKVPSGYDPQYLHHVLLRRSASSAVLAIWHEVSAEDTSGARATPPRGYRRLSHPPFDVAFEWGGRPASLRASEISGRGGLLSVGRQQGGRLRLPVGDDVCLVRIDSVDGEALV